MMRSQRLASIIMAGCSGEASPHRQLFLLEKQALSNCRPSLLVLTGEYQKDQGPLSGSFGTNKGFT